MRRATAVPALAAVPDRSGWDAVLAQVRWTRRRWNVRVGLRTVACLVTLLTTAAAVVVALAVGTGPIPFALGSAGVVIATVALAVVTARAAARTWLSARRAAAWVDTRAGLGGGLATLASVATRPPTALVPLLAARVASRREAYMPGRLVPHVVPRAALAVACAATYAFLLLVTAAPRWRPAPPLPFATPRVHGLPAPDDGVPRALAAAPIGDVGAPGTPGGDPAGAVGGGGNATADAGVVAIPRALQARLQAALWGAPVAVARADGASRDRTAKAPGQAPRGAGTGDASASGPGKSRTDGAVARNGERGSEAGDAAPGAGTATDPDVLGADGVVRHTGSGRFALGLTARVHGPTGAPRPPEGEAPAAEPDEQPALAASARTPAPLRRLGIPPDLAPALRAVYERTGSPRDPVAGGEVPP